MRQVSGGEKGREGVGEVMGRQGSGRGRRGGGR